MSTNYYRYAKSQDQINPNYGKTHCFKVPFRMLVVGSSGSGKSNSMLDIINRMPNTFCKVVLCIPNPDEPLYNLLKDKLGSKLEIYTGEIPTGSKSSKMQPNVPKICEISEEDDKGHRPVLLIADDLCLYEKQDRLCDYYIRGRKCNISMAYLTQSYFKTPITIRRQANYIILKRNVSEADLKRVKNNCSIDISFPDFCRLYRNATQTMEGFLLIDNENSCIYDGFNLQPVYSAYGSNEIKDVESDIPEETKEIFDLGKYEYKTTILQGIQAFAEALLRHYPNVMIPFQDVVDMYKQFCEANNFNIGGDRYLSSQLKKYFNTDKDYSTGVVSFYIYPKDQS